MYQSSSRGEYDYIHVSKTEGPDKSETSNVRSQDDGSGYSSFRHYMMKRCWSFCSVDKYNSDRDKWTYSFQFNYSVQL